MPAKVAVKAVRSQFTLDDGNRGRNAVFLQQFAQHHLARKRCAGQLGAVCETVPVHMHQHQSPAVFGGDIGYGHGR